MDYELINSFIVVGIVTMCFINICCLIYFFRSVLGYFDYKSLEEKYDKLSNENVKLKEQNDYLKDCFIEHTRGV